MRKIEERYYIHEEEVMEIIRDYFDWGEETENVRVTWSDEGDGYDVIVTVDE